jgi:hypothetical protein
MDITLSFSEMDLKIITFYYGDPEIWVKNQVLGQLQRATDATILKQVKTLLNTNQPVPDTKDAILALVDLTPTTFPQPVPPF